jgi:hypothetical protein
MVEGSDFERLQISNDACNVTQNYLKDPSYPCSQILDLIEELCKLVVLVNGVHSQ